jgi:predicted metal-dependent enzyme (double-stranded beta helix superfamily)
MGLAIGEVMFDVDELIAACQEAVREAQPQLAVRDVLERTMREPAAVLRALPAERAAVVALHASDELTVLQVVWAPGMRIRPHDHLMWAAIGLYAGQEDNAFYRRSGGRMVASGGKEIRVGDVALLGDDVVHSVTNPLRQCTAAIHVYGGDLTTCPGRIEWDAHAQREVPYDFGASQRYFAEANAAMEAAAAGNPAAD